MTRNDRHYHFQTIIVFSTLVVLVGCSSKSATTGPPATNPSTTAPASGFYQFDDPRCTPDQQKAIRAATLAVVGTITPTAKQLSELHYTVGPADDGWLIMIWQFGPTNPPVPGGFTDVSLNRDFSVQKIIGGA